MVKVKKLPVVAALLLLTGCAYTADVQHTPAGAESHSPAPASSQQTSSPISVTGQHSSWQGPKDTQPSEQQAVFFERNKETFEGGYYRYCTVATTYFDAIPHKPEGGRGASASIDCTPVFGPDNKPVG